MNTPTKVAAFAVGLAAVFAAAAGIGTLTGPVGTASSATAPAEHADERGSEHGAGHDPAGDAEHLPGGLMVAQDGYRLDLRQRRPTAADDVALTFRVLGPEGRAHHHGRRLTARRTPPPRPYVAVAGTKEEP